MSHIQVQLVGIKPISDSSKTEIWTVFHKKITDWGTVQLEPSFNGKTMSGEEFFPISFRKLF